jgi:hypothetical protein
MRFAVINVDNAGDDVLNFVSFGILVKGRKLKKQG